MSEPVARLRADLSSRGCVGVSSGPSGVEPSGRPDTFASFIDGQQGYAAYLSVPCTVPPTLNVVVRLTAVQAAA